MTSPKFPFGIRTINNYLHPHWMDVEMMPVIEHDALLKAAAQDAEGVLDELIESMKVILRITERNHDAWNSAKKALEKYNLWKSGRR